MIPAKKNFKITKRITKQAQEEGYEKVKKSPESDYPRPEALAFRPIHALATAISKAFFRQSQVTLIPPKGCGFPRPNKEKDLVRNCGKVTG